MIRTGRTDGQSQTPDIGEEPTVQLLHELPDGSSHIDWMLSPGPEADRPLATFRVDRPLEELAADETLDAERINDHRRRYLRFEGPISGDRGSVRRVAEGVIESWEADPGGSGDGGASEPHWRLRVRWTRTLGEDVVQHLRVERPGPMPQVQIGDGGAPAVGQTEKTGRARIICVAAEHVS